MIQHINVGQIIDAAPARVLLTRDDTGSVTSAAFDLSGLPRVDSLLVGRPVVEVPALVERLCGICPAAHHLAGTRALESLAGLSEIPPTAQAVRRLLHYAGVIAIHAVSLIVTDQGEALVLRRFAKAVMTAAGSPGHFPATAVPGGVVAPVDLTQRDLCLGLLAEAYEAARRVVEHRLDIPHPPDSFGGADLGLVDGQGHVDLFGMTLRAVAHDGTPVIENTQADEWDTLVAEAVPGSSAPKPYLVALGPDSGAYRVGPVAQLRVGTLSTPQAAEYQRVWSKGCGARSARAIVILHAIEVIDEVLNDPQTISGEVALPWSPHLPAAVGIGLVDGARGLLVHRYHTDETGHVKAASILTPTAQNEPWLGGLLREAVDGSQSERDGIEDAIREADPCLPCSSAPSGTMDVVVDTVTDERGR